VLTPTQVLLSVFSGFFVGFSLGLIGGGGSILAVPLLLYFVGLSGYPDAVHVAVGSTALAVGLNAFINSAYHLRRRNVDLKTGTIFATAGVAGSLLGAQVGRTTPGDYLLGLFAISMIAIGLYMLLPRGGTRDTVAPYPRRRLVLVVLAGFAVGFLSGFLGIGGGFLIVPALVYIGGIDVRLAVGTSLICVGTFGLVTGVEYLLAGKVLLSVVLTYLSGGLAGGYLGARLAVGIDRRLLRSIYGVAIVLAGTYILLKSLSVI